MVWHKGQPRTTEEKAKIGAALRALYASGRRQPKGNPKPPSTKPCAHCLGVMVGRPQRIAIKKYCSPLCRALGRRVCYYCPVCNRRRNSQQGSGACRPCWKKTWRGEKTPNWKGGITPINKQARRTPEYIAWRKTVFERDNYTCVECGARGVELHADHIKSFAFYPKLRHEVSNGRTLCVPCHKKTPNYLMGAVRMCNAGAAH
jgi:5-methylcytosine-specific restriction endonuclease McrA